MKKELIKYDIQTAVISALDKEYKDIQIKDSKSYLIVMQGLAKYRDLRIKIDDKHKELKKDALEYGRAVDTEKNRLKALLEPGENHLKEIRQVEDDRKQGIKEKKAAKERERIEAIQEKINNIRDLGIMLPNVSALVIEERLIIIKGQMLTQEVFQEFTNQAEDAHNSAIATLEEAFTQRLQFEKEQAERKAEAERLEVQRKEQAEAQAKIDEENRKIDEKAAKLAKADRKLEEEKRTERERRKRVEFERQATFKAEKEALEKASKAESDRIEAAKAEAKEKARQEALRPDKEKLIKFAEELLDIGIPATKSTKAQKMLSDASKMLDELAERIKERAKEL